MTITTQLDLEKFRRKAKTMHDMQEPLTSRQLIFLMS